MTAPTWTAREMIDASTASSRDAVAAERERAAAEYGFEAEHPILPATDEDSFRSGLQEHYGTVRQDVMAHLRDVYDFALWFNAYAGSPNVEDEMCEPVRTQGIGVLVDSMREAGEIGWKYATVRKYRVLAEFEWKDLAKCGSLKKALTWCANEKRTPAEREGRKERKATMRTRERLHLQEIEVLGCQLDEQSKELRELREENRLLRGAADPTEYKALEECVESHALAERMAHRKLDLSEALGRTKDRKMERMGRELGALRVALAARPPSNGNGNGNGAERDGSSLLLSIGKNRGDYVDPGEQS